MVLSLRKNEPKGYGGVDLCHIMPLTSLLCVVTFSTKCLVKKKIDGMDETMIHIFSFIIDPSCKRPLLP